MYDGVDSWVSKFVLKEKTAKKDILKYLENTDCEAVKLGKLYDITSENIIAFKLYGDASQVEIYDRFCAPREKTLLLFPPFSYNY